MAEKTRLTRWGQMAKEHWRKFRPKMYRDLEQSGKLEEMLFKHQEMAKREAGELARQGLNQIEIEEIVLPQYILLPSEAEMPNLGQSA